VRHEIGAISSGSPITVQNTTGGRWRTKADWKSNSSPSSPSRTHWSTYTRPSERTFSAPRNVKKVMHA